MWHPAKYQMVSDLNAKPFISITFGVPILLSALFGGGGSHDD